MKIGIGNDHRGVELKNKITNYLNKKYEVINYGTDTLDTVDYPVIAFKVSEEVRDKNIDLGILICGTGIGMSIAANKVHGIRCAKINTINDAHFAKEHNNANVLAIANNIDIELIKQMLDEFLKTKFNTTPKYTYRNEMLDKYGC